MELLVFERVSVSRDLPLNDLRAGHDRSSSVWADGANPWFDNPPVGTIVLGHEQVIYMGNGDWQPL